MAAQTFHGDGLAASPAATLDADQHPPIISGDPTTRIISDAGRHPANDSNGDKSNSIATIANSGPASGGSGADNEFACNKAPAASQAKPNGLKNRIIQRPPPLVLDKVSNFYDADTNSCIVQPQRQQRQNVAPNGMGANSNNAATKNAGRRDHSKQTATENPQIYPETQSVSDASQTDETSVNDRTSSNNNANQKFWASLNENASRNKALANARSVSTTTATSLINTNSLSRKSNIQTDSVKSLEPDLIIKHRSTSSGAISSSRVVSTLAAHKLHQHHPHEHNGQNDGHSNVAKESAEKTLAQNSERQPANNGHHRRPNENNQRDALNVSDDPDEGPVADSNGGNLVGVDTTTPPVAELAHPSSQSVQLEEPPPSATSSRPRSTNPFLNENDDDFEEYRNSIRSESANRNSFSSKNQSNFHKRPASFIAATDRLVGLNRATYDFAAKQQIIEEKLNEFHINEHPNDRKADLESYQVLPQMVLPQTDQIDSNAGQQLAHYNLHQTASNQMHPENLYGSGKNRYSDPTISIDSESTICQPPPSATMQLPHWTEAIYELNNAILEPSSLGGGSDNGQFIYIVESGDIILELDRVKVSGFTLAEFSKLVDSKQFHLLAAVQTKHSRGLLVDLKKYLNISFPKNSKDKQLQNTIRENIYLRTIPCTTRPPRPGERDKVDYHFLTKEQFADLNRRGMLLECGVYVGHFYGTLKPTCDLDRLSEHSQVPQDNTSNRMRQAWDSNHPAVEMMMKKDASNGLSSEVTDHPLYENHESLRMQMQHYNGLNNVAQSVTASNPQVKQANIVATDSEALPPGWERVVDQTHGTYYIDHNTQKTQFERPYEVELTKGLMGFGFTLVEADSGLLLVRSIIPGGPAHLNGSIKPGDILVSAIGVSVTGLQHTDIARLFSTFAVGDRVRLTFARSNYILDDNIVPDEYLFSNGTNGDLAIAVNPNNGPLHQNLISADSPHILVNQEFDYIQVTLKRGDQGFGFTISDSIAGQRIRKIQNHEICSNLKQGDILVNLNGEDITKLTHKDVVERLKQCPAGDDVTLTVKRKKRFRSKTPMAMHTDARGEYLLNSAPQRNCKTPSLDGLMLKRPGNYNSKELTDVPGNPFGNQNQDIQGSSKMNAASFDGALMNGLPVPQTNSFEPQLYGSLPVNHRPQVIYGENNPGELQHSYRTHGQHSLPSSSTLPHSQFSHIPVEVNSMQSNDASYREDNIGKLQDPSMTHGGPRYHSNLQVNDFNQLNQYNNFMHNDKLVMMQMHQPRYQPQNYSSSDYHQLPVYSNNEILTNEIIAQHDQNPALPVKPPFNPYLQTLPNLENLQNNFYANNEEIALQSMQYNYLSQASQMPASADQFTFMRPVSHGTPHDEHDEYEYHNVDLSRESTESNWGIRLIGGAEVDRAISIGSMIQGGVAATSGKLKSGDEIVSIDGVNVVGATHQHVVELISACTNKVSLVVRRKTFAEACDVVLTKNMDEGFGFVIISNENCALIGKIIEGSPADRCKQLRVRDCIIAVNGRYIAPDMKHPEIVNMIKECGSTLRLRIIPVDCYTVKLIKDVQNDSFGFRMRGGSEYDGTPLYIVRVEPHGQAHGLLNVGDQILEINNIPTVGMTHQQAATIIKYSDPIVKLKLRRNYVTPPSLLVDSPRSLQKYNQTAEMKQVNLASTPNMQAQNSYDTSFASLPGNVNLMSQQQPMPMAVPLMDPNLHPVHQQSICDRHSMIYTDQGAMYAT